MLSLNALIFQCRDPAISHRDDDNLRLFFFGKKQNEYSIKTINYLEGSNS
jgi:hypothetical protein